MTKASLRFAACILTLGLVLCAPAALFGQAVDPTGRPVSEIRVQGLRQVPELLVRNQIRVQPGDPFDERVVHEDVVRIEHLGKFAAVKANVQQRTDGTLELTYQVQEQTLITDLQVVGNKHLSDQKLLEEVLLRSGDPIDRFLVDQAVEKIKAAYERAGYFLTQVTVDQKVLDETGALIFQIREGPRVKIKAIRCEGNTTFSAKELRSQIKSQADIPLLFWRKTELNRVQLDLDVAKVRQYYQDRGFLEVKVGRRVDLSPNQKGAVVVFLIEEGPRYTLGSVRTEGNLIFTTAQITEAMPMRVGDLYSAKSATDSQEAVLNLYGKLGFIETTAEFAKIFRENEPIVDLLIRIDEGQPYLVGSVEIRGNSVTKDRVILRDLRGLTPDRPFDRGAAKATEKRLKQSPLFSEAKVTVLGQPEDEVRDALVEVQEGATGNISLGVGVSSDLGLLGSVRLTQRNFDIADYPESFKEFLTARSFRGAGQFFSLDLAPGIDNSQYSLTFREPYLFETDYFLENRVFFSDRDRDDWREERLGDTVGLGRRFGDRWSATLQSRVEVIDIFDVESTAPTDVFAVQGGNFLTSVSPILARNTTDDRFVPSKGSVLTLSPEQTGALGGDYDFTTVSLDFRKFWTIEEDFLGRKTILSLRTSAGYIVDGDAPVFERLYAGGHRTFRGFEYRGVGPRGITPGGAATDEAVGGDFLYLLGLEYNIPIYQEMIRQVFFVDTGTVQTDAGLEQYRVAVGTGFRLRLPFFSQGGPPIALDFTVPVMKEDGDQTRILSFDLALPFQ
ncbi:MAG: BamA/TamA family outer membrane protein [Phycisphaeraceae bacterium]|nr:BamA/TamA family outer membrane protein [Phycisphaeraceae bacterium]